MNEIQKTTKTQLYEKKTGHTATGTQFFITSHFMEPMDMLFYASSIFFFHSKKKNNNLHTENNFFPFYLVNFFLGKVMMIQMRRRARISSEH